jgi:hypothetical protein
MDTYHLVFSEDEWKLRRTGAERSAMTFDSKGEAMKESVEFMRDHGGSLRIHKHTGAIQEERTYPRSADPRKSPG